VSFLLTGTVTVSSRRAASFLTAFKQAAPWPATRQRRDAVLGN
jgi:hypothetical protein